MRRRDWMVFGITGSLLFGCAEKPRSYTPEVPDAQAAIERCMEAWKDGLTPGEIPGKPVVHITDVNRKPDQRLQSYQILGETRGTTGRTIVVSLQMTNPAEEIKVRYVIVGIDPLWVFRQEDYELLMHWDHYMPEKKPETVVDDGNAATSPDETNPDQRSIDRSRKVEESSTDASEKVQ